MDTEIISSLYKKSKNSTKLKKEVEQIKQNLTETKKTTQDKNKNAELSYLKHLLLNMMQRIQI